MDNDKNMDFDDEVESKETEYASESSTRARNRTVMLTPEITGQVRARLAQELEGGGPPSYPRAQEPASAGSYVPGGGNASSSSGGFYTPASRASAAAPPPQGLPAPGRVAAAPEPVRGTTTDGAVWVNESPVIGFLVSFDANSNGDIFTLRSGRLIVSSGAQASGNFVVIPDETVSPLHAIMRISAEGEIQVLDQLSEHGTKIKRFGSEEEEELSGEKSTLEHGDVIKFGKRSFHVCVIAK